MRSKGTRIVTLVSVLALLVTAGVLFFATPAAAELTDGDPTIPTDAGVSHRFIVELQSPPLAVKYQEMAGAASADGSLDLNSAAAQSYLQQLQAEQAAFIAEMKQALPNAEVSNYVNEFGDAVDLQAQIVLNAVVVDAGFGAGANELKALRSIAGVKGVYPDYAHVPQTYTSMQLINADDAWAALGGQANAGKGIKVASMDGGLHHDAPMFKGNGWSYPQNFPEGGLGLTANNNGKIIASRVYFRAWDPPAPGDANAWPGQDSTSHGVHTGSTAAGNRVDNATYLGTTLPALSGVAPGAWVGSYRVFYESVTSNGSFYTAEGIAALEDIVKDDFDVVNNSWGGGPGGVGGPFDALDTALRNAVAAGVFVSMSAGNSGPNPGTGDHPSTDYINSAASTTAGTYVAARIDATTPDPVPENTKDLPAGTALFGPPLAPTTVFGPHPYKAAANVAAANIEGCQAFPANTFDNSIAVIKRGSCAFTQKVKNAQDAGAVGAIIYNLDGDNNVINMGGSDASITISSFFVGNSSGANLVAHQDANPNAQLQVTAVASQLGNTPDMIANFSSRGPTNLSSLKPDVAAPGVNIMAQGYDPLAVGEARHLGFGQVSGTSMAAPHTAGAAALLEQKYPTWSVSQIKSALMGTAKYMDIYNADGSPAQPTDMGAGRIDVMAAMDPGVLLDPPAADFGLTMTGTAKTMEIKVHNVSSSAETYNISTIYTGESFTQTTPVMGLSVSPNQVTLNPGEMKTIQVTFNPALGMGFNVNQGYIKLDGPAHDVHMPFFSRVYGVDSTADVLLIDVDMSPFNLGFGSQVNYSAYYTETLENLGVSYHYWDTAPFVTNADKMVPDFATLKSFKKILIFTGDHFAPDGSFAVSTPLTDEDQEALNEYAQAGGDIFIMGQDASWVMDGSFLQGAVFGAVRVADSVSNNGQPMAPIVSYNEGPAIFNGVYLDLSSPGGFLGEASLLGANEVPPVANSGKVTGTATVFYDEFTSELAVFVDIEVSEPLSVTAGHIHSGTAGMNGPVLYPILTLTQPHLITDTYSFASFVTLTDEHNMWREEDRLYFNIHSVANGSGEIRGQVPSTVIEGDGAGNQVFIDEYLPDPLFPDPQPVEPNSYLPILRYAGGNSVAEGTVAIAHRDQPTLERPGISYLGASIATGFGLEGVNNHDEGWTTREELLGLMFNWAMDEPTVTISHTAEYTTSETSVFGMNFASNISGASPVSARWDWGDGSPYSESFPVLTSSGWAGHSYTDCGEYTVRVEVTDNYGNKALASKTVNITACGQAQVGVVGSSGGTFITDNQMLTFEFPSGAVSGETRISVKPHETPKVPVTTFDFAGVAFTVTAVDSNGNPVTQFAKPFKLTVRYSDQDWKQAGIAKESDLNVAFYNGTAWIPLMPCAGCNHDMEKNEIVVVLDHLTEFAVVGMKEQMFFPFIGAQ